MNRSLITVGLAAAFTISTAYGLPQQGSSSGGSSGGSAQQTAPDAPQPQQTSPNPSKKSKKKSPSPNSSSNASSKPSSNQSPKPKTGADQNEFPEAVSEKAAQAAGNAQSPSNKAPSSGKQSSPEKNAFPEDVSRKAAEAAAGKSGGATGSQGKPAAPSGEASSTDGGLTDNGDVAAPAIEDPHRAKNDNSVGAFYMGRGDYKGAYMRYQDAMKYDPGDLDAVFGAAEAARKLGNRADAMRDYQLYLAVEPNGSKAKRAMKAMDELTQNK